MATKDNTKIIIKLDEMGKRVPHGGFVVIAKRVKKSEFYVRNFFKGMYKVNSTSGMKIIEATKKYLDEVTATELTAEIQMDAIISEFPIVKEPKDNGEF